MTLNDEKCLKALAEICSYGEYFCGFAPIIEETGLPRRDVRLSIRRLARKGLAEYSKGLWDESTGLPAGAGYRITTAGREFLKEKHGKDDG